MSDPRYHNQTGGLWLLSGRNDRRRACRYVARLPECLSRWRDESDWIDTPCRIVDISVAGCLVESPRLQRLFERQAVWLRPVSLPMSDWTEGFITSVRSRLFRKCQIRITFLAALPYETFKALVYGTDELGTAEFSDSPDHEKDHFWK
jgi:hypothetical protein